MKKFIQLSLLLMILAGFPGLKSANYVVSGAGSRHFAGYGELSGLSYPSYSMLGASLSYNTSVFTESPENDGTIDNTLVITCDNAGGETFAGTDGEDFVLTRKVVVSNLPNGLTARIIRTSNLTLLAVLTGTATSHTNASDISNLSFAFQNSSFSGGNASAVGSATRSLSVNFIQIIHVGSSGDYTTIAAALAAARDGDILNLAAQTFTESDLTIGDMNNLTPYLSNVTIQGQGAESTIVQGASSPEAATSSVFLLDNQTTVTIKDLTIRNGKSDRGGGIFSAGAQLNLVNVDISNNIATNMGGGVYAKEGNRISMINCTLHDNSGGSGLYLDAGSASIVNSTIAYNSGISATGGGITCDYLGSLELTNSTVNFNQPNGISATTAATISMVNSMLIGNSVADYKVTNGVTLNDNGYNIVEKQNSSNVSGDWRFTNTTDILWNLTTSGSASTQWNRNDAVLANQSVDLKTELLDNSTLNGTKTFAIGPTSFAVNAGTNAGAPTTDQRGKSRNGRTDIGAYEYGGISVIPPTVATTAISTFSYASATMGGNVSSDGGGTVTERGVVYKLSGTPDISDTKVQIGSGTGTFSESISGLMYNTTYYVRAYATNSAGTAYGTLQTFTTAPTTPVISNLDGDTGSFTVGDTPLPIDNGGNASVTASVFGYKEGNLTVAIGSVLPNEYLSIRTLGTVSLSSGMNAGSSVTVGSTTIGSIASWNTGQAGENLIVNFNANATNALISTLLQNITYSNLSPASPGTRTVMITVRDAAVFTSNAVFATISATRSIPVISNLDGDTGSFKVGDTPLAIDKEGNATVINPVFGYNGGNLTVAIASALTSEVLSVRTSGTLSLGNGMNAGSTVTVGSTSIGTIASGKDGQAGHDLVISLNAGATNALISTLLQNITYSYISPASLGTRTVSVTVQDATALTSNAVSASISATRSNPVISNLDGDSGSFKEGDAPLAIDNAGNATVTNPVFGYNGGNLTVAIASASTSEVLSIRTSGTISLSNGMNAGSSVTVGSTSIGTIASGKDGQAGNNLVISLNAGATEALVSSLIQNVTYSNNSEVLLGTRTVSVTVLEATSLTSNTATILISTLVVNDPPTLTMDASDVTPTFTNGDLAVRLFSGDGTFASASTGESGQTFKGFVITVTNVSDGAAEQLLMDGSYIALTNGTSGTSTGNNVNYSVSVTGSTATVTISGGSLSAASLVTVINQLSYYNNKDYPTAGNRVITIISLTDSGGIASGGIDTVTLAISSTVTVVTLYLPTVTTAVITTFDVHSATMGGSVTADGGASVYSRGVVYSKSDDTPALSETNVIRNDNGTGTGTFNKSITGLLDGTTYYVRAFASNSKGTAYGSTVTFSTPSGPLAITTTPETVVEYGSVYKYSIAATTIGELTTTFTTPTLPGWLSFTPGQTAVTSFGTIPDNSDCATADEAGNIYAVTGDGISIYKVQPDGTTTLWGSNFGTVGYLHIADGYLYFGTSSSNNVSLPIKRIPLSDPSATPETFATFSYGVVALTHKDGWIYASDYSAHKIYRINEVTKEVQTYLDLSLDSTHPYGLTFAKDGKLYIATFGNNIGAVYIYDGTTISLPLDVNGNPIYISGEAFNFIQQDAYGYFYVATSMNIYYYSSDFRSKKAITNLPPQLLLYTTSDELVYNDRIGSDVYHIKPVTILTGTPSKSALGYHPVVVRATNDNGYTEQSFTINVIDAIKPEMTALLPADGATGVTLRPALSVTFDEAVSLGNTGTLTLQSGATTLESFDLSISDDRNALTLSADQKTLNISLRALLPSNSPIGVSISDGFVKDLSGNAFAGITIASGTWDFATMLAQNPVFSNLNGDLGSFKEGDSPLLIDNGANAAIIDSNASGFNGGNLTVAVSSPSASEFLSIKTSVSVTLSNGMNAGSTVSIGGTAIGTIATGKDGLAGHDLVVTLNENATGVRIGTLIQNVTYSNNSEIALGSRSVVVTVQDAFVYTSAPSTVTISTSVVNDPPTFIAVGTNPTFTEGDATVTLFSNASASTFESGQTFAGLTLTVTNVSDGSSDQLYLDGSLVSLTNGTTGSSSANSLTYSISVTGSTATVTVTGGSLSAANLHALVNSLGYYNSKSNPTEANRVVTITSLTDSGGTSNGGNDTVDLAVASTVTVIAKDQPTVITDEILTFSGTSATMGGNVPYDGGALVTERGVVYSSGDTTPTIGEAGVTKDVDESIGVGTFSKSVNGLSIGTTYYVEAYATNSAGTAYGSVQSFTTKGLPTVTTTAITTYNSTSATLGGNATDDGGEFILQRGVVYSSSDTAPMIGETGVRQDVIGVFKGTFSKSVTELLSGTTYFVVAYATNRLGTAYGSVQTFTTTTPPTLTPPTIATTAITTYNSTSATMGGDVTADGGATVTERGVVYSTSDSTPTIREAGVKTNASGTTGTGTFSMPVTGLSNLTTYYAAAYATNSEGTVYGSVQSFTTTAPPTVTTTAITTYNLTSATLGGNVTADGGVTVTERGVVYSSIDAIPTIGDAGVTKDANGSGTGVFSKSVTGFSNGTTYYVRAYATNSEGTSYGSVQTFWTVVPPTITTTAITTYNNNSATLGGNVTASGGGTVTERGVVYSSGDTTPTIGETGVTKNANGSGTGTFSESVTGLSIGTAYFVVAYAINSAGTVYGSVETFTTPVPPTVTTTAITTFAGTSATMGGNVTASGGGTVTERGVVYSSGDTTPTIGETGVTKNANGSGTGTFSESVTGLSSGTIYYVVAYATNSAGTAYGSVQVFTTVCTLTDIRTYEILTYNGTTATMGGVFVATGESAVTERGVVYSSGDNTPTIGETGVTKDVNGSEARGFSESVTGLSGGTTYYVAAYATNCAGTAYGSVKTFTTTAPPTVVTAEISAYNSTSATLGGNVTASGGATVTERGVAYSSVDNTPTIGEAGVTMDANGSGTGTFSESVTGLSKGTTYYVAAYATNSEGTAYGSAQSFTTNGLPTVTTTAITTYNATSATLGGNVTADGGTTVTGRGVVYSSGDNTPTIGEEGVTQDVNGTTGTGIFSKSVSGLSNATTYYVAAYATNNDGTAYGSVNSFNTTLAIPADPSAITATYNTVCHGASTQLTATGALGTVYWYTASCDGTQVTTGNPVTVTPLVNTTYYARNFNNGAYSAGCSSIDIVVKPRPTVADLQATGTQIKWYLTETGGTPLATTTQLINGQYYWASQTIDGQESTVRLGVLVTITNP